MCATSIKDFTDDIFFAKSLDPIYQKWNKGLT